MTHSSLGFFFCSGNRGKDPRKSKKETYLDVEKKGKEAVLFWRKNVFKSFESEAVKDMLVVRKTLYF